MALKKIKILIHPDIFYSGHSGAIAARESARQLSKLGYEVGVFTHDKENKDLANYPYFQRIPYNGTANYFRSIYINSFNKVIQTFNPDFVFFIGGIVNTPISYLDICYKNGIKTVFLLLVQDFYCARLHAGLGTSSCSLCLRNSNLNALRYNCSEKQPRPFLYFINYQLSQKLFLPRLRKVNYMLGSSKEQLGFYEEIGIKKSNIVKIPLFFNHKRVKQIKCITKPYFVIIGQFRHEKGIHLISSILDNINEGIVVKLLLFNKEEADKFFKKYPENQKHLQSGRLKVLPGVTMTNGAVELIAGSKGVINPTIWATTTEFVLLEVLGLSKPIITFDVGIHKEIIKNRINGICVRAGDFKSMGDEINNLNDNPALEDVIAKGAIQLYHKLTDESIFTKTLTNIFQ